MFWFPAPERVDPRVEEFLAFEREWLTGEWTLDKILITSVVPLSLIAFCLAFSKRSLLWGLITINVIALTKVLWGVVSGEGSGWVMLGPALAGLLVCDAVVLYAARKLRMRSSGHSQPASEAATKNPARDPDGAISTFKQQRSHG
jgi:hypothetical protein